MTDRKQIRVDFESRIDIPAYIVWDEEAHGYFPVPSKAKNESIVYQAQEVNIRFASYIAGRTDKIVRMSILEKMLMESTGKSLEELDWLVSIRQNNSL